MNPGLPAALHLAANLLAFAAAAGLALYGVGRIRRAEAGTWRHQAGWLTMMGAAALVLGFAMDGALIAGRVPVVAWLLAGGLVAVALGALPRPLLTSGPAIVLPLAPMDAGIVALAAGTAAGYLGFRRGGGHRLLAVGLVLWGAARLVAAVHPLVGSAITVAGAVAVGAWLWHIGARHLLSRIVTTFVAAVALMAVLFGGVLGSLTSTELEHEEVASLHDAGRDIAREITMSWPQEAIDTVRPARAALPTVDDVVERGDVESLTALLRRPQSHDLIAVLSPDGDVELWVASKEVMEDQRMVSELLSSDTVQRLLDGAQNARGVSIIDDRVVAVGGVTVPAWLGSQDPVAQQFGSAVYDGPARHVVISARVADESWAAIASARMPAEIGVEVNGQVRSSGGTLGGSRISDLLGFAADGGRHTTLTEDGTTAFVVSQPLVRGGDPDVAVGQVVLARSGELLDRLEHEQLRRLFLLTLLTGAVAATAAAFVASRVVGPVRRLTATAAAVEEGRLEARADIGSGDEIGVLGAAFDRMTRSLEDQSAQLRAAAEEQSRLRARLEALTDSMRDALIAVDADGKVIMWNPAAQRLVGREGLDAIGQPLATVLEGRTEDGRRAASALVEAAGRRPVSLSLELRTPHGIVPAAASAARVYDSQRTLLGSVFVVRDVSHETDLERMKSEFLANVSHELRTPLTPIKGYAQLLATQREATSPMVQQFAQSILVSTERLERLVGLIIDFAAMDAGTVRAVAEAVPVDAAVGALVADWHARAGDRELEVDVECGLPPLRVDLGLLRRALDELIDNALKFSGPDGPVTVAARLTAPERITVSVRSRSDGGDLDPQEIFTEFFQGDSSASRRHGGLGLGLALVRRIADVLTAEVRAHVDDQGRTVVGIEVPADPSHVD